MANRITGLATGLDVDALVSAEMTSYKSKVDKKQQEHDILKIKQEMYRDVYTQCTAFYDKYLNIAKSDCLLSAKSFVTTSFTSNSSSVSAKANSGSAIKDNYEVTVSKLAKTAKVTINASEISGDSISIKINGKDTPITIDKLSAITSKTDENEKNTELAKVLNEQLAPYGLKARYSEISGGVVLETTAMGDSAEFSISGLKNADGSPLIKQGKGENSEFEIKNSSGEVYNVKSANSNNVTVDGITFSFNAVTTGTGAAKLTASTDANAAADKIIGFIEDYNSLLTNLNKLVMTKHDKNYSPLTEEQKKDMSESQVKKWEDKVKEGQLYNDSAINKIISDLKNAMSTEVDGKGNTLASIGIKLNPDYGSKAGTYAVDKEKLVAAFESDPDRVMNLFISTSKESDTNVKYSKTGFAQRIKSIVEDKSTSSTYAIVQKAGKDSTDVTSTLSKQIADFSKKIKTMKADLATREQKLYSKYAALEKIMNNYNNQLSTLTSAFSS